MVLLVRLANEVKFVVPVVAYDPAREREQELGKCGVDIEKELATEVVARKLAKVHLVKAVRSWSATQVKLERLDGGHVHDSGWVANAPEAQERSEGKHSDCNANLDASLCLAVFVKALYKRAFSLGDEGKPRGPTFEYKRPPDLP